MAAVKKSANPSTKSSARSPGVVTSKDTSAALASRYKFLALISLVAAALLAISLGLTGYNHRGTRTHGTRVPIVQRGEGAIFLDGSPTGGLAKGSTFKVSIQENSGREPINAVQAAVTYPADKLKVVDVSDGTAFTQVAATDTSTPGLVRVARGTQSHAPAVTGAQTIVTIEFSVISSDQPVELKVDKNFSLLVRSTDHRNILR